MTADLRGIFETTGQSAALMFAAFIFMGFLQQRYTAAYERYRSVVDEIRSGRLEGRRQDVVRAEVLLYKRRCEMMKRAVNCGLSAGVLLASTLFAGVANITAPGVDLYRWVGTATAFGGLGLLIVACVLVIRENAMFQQAIDGELLDLPELAEDAGLAAHGGDPLRRGHR